MLRLRSLKRWVMYPEWLEKKNVLRLEAKIEATKAEIIKWMFGTIGFQTIIILGAVIALARALVK